LINNLLLTFINPGVVAEQPYGFSESGVFRIPLAGDLAGFLEYIKELPLAPKPEVSDTKIGFSC
jgi:hypothetical protein